MSNDRLRFLFLNLGHAYAHLFMLLYATVVLARQAQSGLDYGELLLPSTAGFVAFAAGTLPAGWLGDRWSRQGLPAVMFLGLGAASLLTALAGETWQLAADLAAIGLFAAIYHPIGIAMVAEEADQLGRALGVNGVWGNMGVAAAALLAGTLSAAWGWRAAFALPGAVALATGVGFLLLIRHAPPAKERRTPPPARPASPALVRRVFVFIPVASLFGGLVFSAMIVALPKILAEALAGGGDGLLSAGSLAAAIFAIAAFAQIVTGARRRPLVATQPDGHPRGRAGAAVRAAGPERWLAGAAARPIGHAAGVRRDPGPRRLDGALRRASVAGADLCAQVCAVAGRVFRRGAPDRLAASGRSTRRQRLRGDLLGARRLRRGRGRGQPVAGRPPANWQPW